MKPRYACAEGFCGADDCKTCHPLNVDDADDEREELQDEQETE